MENNTVLSQIGNTPLVRLRQASELTGCNIYGKAEYFNPGESVKDRAALFIVQDALKRKLISKGGTIVEGTAGNTGIGLAIVCREYGLNLKIVFKIKPKRPIVICVFDKDKIKEYVKILNKLRASNISSEIFPGEGKLRKQMEYANKISSPAVILYGDNEIKSGNVTLRNLETGNETSIKIDNLANEIKKLF